MLRYGADLFGSYVATILATMVLGAEVEFGSPDKFNGLSPILIPMVIAGLIFLSLQLYFVKIKPRRW